MKYYKDENNQVYAFEADSSQDAFIPESLVEITEIEADALRVQQTPIYIPTVVSMRQARLALLDAGLLATVNDAVAAMTGNPGEAARIEWEYATEVRRDSPLVDALSAALSLDAETLDSLFTTAASL